MDEMFKKIKEKKTGEKKEPEKEAGKKTVDDLRELIKKAKEKKAKETTDEEEKTSEPENKDVLSAPKEEVTPIAEKEKKIPPIQKKEADKPIKPPSFEEMKLPVREPVKEKKENIQTKEVEEKKKSFKASDPLSLMGKEISETEKEMQREKKEEVDRYKKTTIYKVHGKDMYYYHTPVPRPSGTEKAIINVLKEVATRIITISPYRIRDPEQRRNVYYNKLMDILKASPELNIPAHKYEFYADAVVREMVGYGLIDELIRDDLLEEIMIIGPQQPVYVFHRKYEMMFSNIEFYSDKEIQDLINRVARQVGRRVDVSSPLLDARLADGSRVNATIPPASVSGSSLTIRKFKADPFSIIDLINHGTMDYKTAAFLWVAVEGMQTNPANILIAGGTGSGKTTTLNVLASFIPSRERIITIEDTAELNLPLEHWIRMEARPPGLEGSGELTMDILTKNTLRMRPDRVLVGEIRHQEAFSLFTAMNTGHKGSMGSVHANSAQETIIRVTNPPMNVPDVMVSGLNIILVQNRIHDKKKGTIRRIIEISEVTGALEGKAKAQSIFERDAEKDALQRTSLPSVYLKELERFTGLKMKEIEKEIDDRAQFLESLSKNNIRKMSEVSQKCGEYLRKQNGE
jgi:archaeal flagellar protein FlaI